MPKQPTRVDLLDAQIAMLKAQRAAARLTLTRDRLTARILELETQLSSERGRTTPDSISAITDISLAKKLQAALEENARLRQRLAPLEDNEKRLQAVRQDIESIGNERNDLAERLAAAELEYSRAVGDLERGLGERLDQRAALAAEAERRRCADYLEAVLSKANSYVVMGEEGSEGYQTVLRSLMAHAAIDMRNGHIEVP